MSAERLKTPAAEIEVVNPGGNGGEESIQIYLNTILCQGQEMMPVELIKRLWVYTLKEGLPVTKTSAIVDGIVNRLPREIRDDLESIVGTGGRTLLTLARETAQKEVELEKKLISSNEQTQLTDKKKKRLSRSKRIYIRRQKSEKRRREG